jgi:hypothetical protein
MNRFWAALASAVICALLLAAPPARGAVGSASRDAVRFAALEIGLWPEFDRKAVLVIIKGELAPDIALPATLSLRIPAVSGGASAVASASARDGQLMNLAHEVVRGAEFITLQLAA